LPKLPRLTAREAEKRLLDNGFELIRTKGSHHVYKRDDTRIIVPFHSGKVLHPKIVKQVLEVMESPGE